MGITGSISKEFTIIPKTISLLLFICTISSPVAPPPSAAVEDVNSINQSETMAENREMDEQKRSGSFFVTESEDADNVPNSELSSFKVMVKLINNNIFFQSPCN